MEEKFYLLLGAGVVITTKLGTHPSLQKDAQSPVPSRLSLRRKPTPRVASACTRLARLARDPSRVLVSAATVKALGGEYSCDGPRKVVDTKEDRVLEAFFVNRRLMSHLQGREDQPTKSIGHQGRY
jgi:hypothetical protein